MNEIERARQDALDAWAEVERTFAALMEILPPPKKKSGRPSIWKDYPGLRFVEAVQKVCREKRCSVAQATKIVQRRWRNQKHPMSPTLEKLKDGRQLEQRYQEAYANWEFRLKGLGFMGTRREQKRLQYEDASRVFEAASERWEKALAMSTGLSGTKSTFRYNI